MNVAMVHSILIVGGTIKKRSKASEEKSLALKTPSERGSGESLAERSQKFDKTLLEPEEDKQTISIDQIRGLQHQLSLKPYAAKFKTGIILEAQRMTIEAQNALLKTLEEPPAHSILILTAPSTKNLLPTTVSRCQIVRLPPEIDLDPESEEHRQAVEEFLQLLGSGRGERLAWVEENKKIINDQRSTLNMLDVWISVLRDLLLTQQDCQTLTLNSFKPRPTSPTGELAGGQAFKPQILTEALDLTIKTKNLIASTNVSPRLALEVLLLDLPVFQP